MTVVAALIGRNIILDMLESMDASMTILFSLADFFVFLICNYAVV
jgi:hypothetical protein